jgi:YggT family protein
MSDWNGETPDRRESVYVTESDAHERRERVVTDAAAERRNVAYSITQLIWLFFGIVIGLIFLRVLLMLIGANPASPFAGFIYDITNVFLWPFFGLTATPSVGNLVLDIPALIAMFVYYLVAWAIAKLVRVLVYRPATSHTVETYDRDQHHHH